MAKSTYLSASDDGFAAQLVTFKNAIGGYAVALGVSPAQITAQAADADYFNYTLDVQQLMANAAKQWTAWKDLIRNGGNPPPTGMPVAPTFPAAVPPVAPGVEARFRALVKQIKANANYNSSIGDALGIEGSEQVGPITPPSRPTSTRKSTVRVWTSIGAGKASAHSSTNANSKSIAATAKASSSSPSTPRLATPTQPFPSAPVKWLYQAIYRVGDQRVGQWSKPVSLTVG